MIDAMARVGRVAKGGSIPRGARILEGEARKRTNGFKESMKKSAIVILTITMVVANGARTNGANLGVGVNEQNHTTIIWHELSSLIGDVVPPLLALSGSMPRVGRMEANKNYVSKGVLRPHKDGAWVLITQNKLIT